MLTALALVVAALAGLVVWSCCAINGRDPADDEEQAAWIARWAEENSK